MAPAETEDVSVRWQGGPCGRDAQKASVEHVRCDNDKCRHILVTSGSGFEFTRGRYFVGPDRQTYKWKLVSHCWAYSFLGGIDLGELMESFEPR